MMTGEFQKSDRRNPAVHISLPISTNHQVSLTKKIKNIALTNNTKLTSPLCKYNASFGNACIAIPEPIEGASDGNSLNSLHN